MKKVKISQLPECSRYTGLYTIGVDDQNRSVKVPLDNIEETKNSIASIEPRIKEIDTLEESVATLEQSVADLSNTTIELNQLDYFGFPPEMFNMKMLAFLVKNPYSRFRVLSSHDKHMSGYPDIPVGLLDVILDDNTHTLRQIFTTSIIANEEGVIDDSCSHSDMEVFCYERVMNLYSDKIPLEYGQWSKWEDRYKMMSEEDANMMYADIVAELSQNFQDLPYNPLQGSCNPLTFNDDEL